MVHHDDKPKRIYISGPMTGVEDHNFPAFNAAAEHFRAFGWDVANPAENFEGRTDLPRTTYLRADIAMLAACDAIALLPGWEESRGATLEALLSVELGLKFFDASSGESFDETPRISYSAENGMASVLDTARLVTEGVRQRDYGHPSDDFARAALMWTAILKGRLRPAEHIKVDDIPLCMIAIKLARQAHRHKRDNLVDIAGYARTAAMVAGEE